MNMGRPACCLIAACVRACVRQGWPTSLRGEALQAKWMQIPYGLDVLVTHGPPYKYGDGDKDYDAGDRGLLRVIKQRRPRVAVFGHIHDGAPAAGSWTAWDCSSLRVSTIPGSD